MSNPSNPIPASRILIGGFSQGGALALHTALRSPHKLAGCVALSSWLPFSSDFSTTGVTALSPAATNLPIFQVHGTADNIVAYKWGEATHKLLQQLIPSAKLLTVHRMGHSTVPHEIVAVREFISNCFAATPLLEEVAGTSSK